MHIRIMIEFWKDRNILPHLTQVKPAVMVVGGFFDAEDAYGTFETYKAIEKQNPKANNILVAGPWFHGGWVRGDGKQFGDIKFRSSDKYRLSAKSGTSVLQLSSERKGAIQRWRYQYLYYRKQPVENF